MNWQTVLGAFAGNIISLLVAVPVLWWRMKSIEGRVVGLERKVDNLNEGSNLVALTHEVERVRDRLHAIEGQVAMFNLFVQKFIKD